MKARALERRQAVGRLWPALAVEPWEEEQDRSPAQVAELEAAEVVAREAGQAQPQAVRPLEKAPQALRDRTAEIELPHCLLFLEQIQVRSVRSSHQRATAHWTRDRLGRPRSEPSRYLR